MASPEPSPIDMITGRPRTPNNVYTKLNDQQIVNIKAEPKTFFFKQRPQRRLKLRYTRDRYAYDMNRQLPRHVPGSGVFCYIDDQYNRFGRPDHNTSRLGASVPWGIEKQGGRTISHFENEDTHRYLTIDCYRRPATNINGPVIMKYGRPGEGYYMQRHPNQATWFGSVVPLNTKVILEDIQPKTWDDHDMIREFKANHTLQRTRLGCEPQYSEYTDRYSLQTRVPTTQTTGIFSYFPWPGNSQTKND